MMQYKTRRLDERTVEALRTEALGVGLNDVSLNGYINPDLIRDKPFRLRASQDKFTHDVNTALSWFIADLWKRDPERIMTEELERSTHTLACVLHKHPQIGGFALDYANAIKDALQRRIAEFEPTKPAILPPRHAPRSSCTSWQR